MKMVVREAGGQLRRAMIEGPPLLAAIIPTPHAQLATSDRATVGNFLENHASDATLNAAAYVRVYSAECDGETASQANISRPGNVTMCLRSTGARLIQLSTCFMRAPCRTRNLSAPEFSDRRASMGQKLKTASITVPSLIRQHECIWVVTNNIGTPISADSLVSAVSKLFAIPVVKGIHPGANARVAPWYDLATTIAQGPFETAPPFRGRDQFKRSSSIYPTPARCRSYSVVDITALRPIHVERAHYPQRLRSLLGEIKSG